MLFHIYPIDIQSGFRCNHTLLTLDEPQYDENSLS